MLHELPYFTLPVKCTSKYMFFVKTITGRNYRHKTGLVHEPLFAETVKADKPT